MYAEPGLVLSFSQESAYVGVDHHHLHLHLNAEELHRRFLSDLSTVAAPAPYMGNLGQATVSEYDLGGEGDLFKAPEPIIEDQVLSLDPLTAAISIIAGNEDVITTETIESAEMHSMQQGDLLSDVFYGCKDFLAKAAIENFVSEVPNFAMPSLPSEKTQVFGGDGAPQEIPLQKSVSSGSLISSGERINSCHIRPNFLDFQELDLGVALRRAYSEGDIQTLGNKRLSSGATSIVHYSLTIGDANLNDKIEERRQKISRYRKKKSKRNFGRKIKYACRKALADSQPRVRGRFAKTDECDAPKPHK
ncbi:zinc finger protein CONSTANS-LIKE 9-like isoform X1 [Dioscorea cayenensis subsp. rotundata]|uniref:Zinc finger protein CONSTANS-LIKE 9-like isoform X1 n=1 Tax=Dioscorea cayennensis subsp. rotundata TaxID=55577 RepID=A0AB40CVU2_DIOCR|nr:zinc finger protein CONSTANS-LIKE 9-like isoform X1 [Dioscorea cayenensis subsp. rotundata]